MIDRIRMPDEVKILRAGVSYLKAEKICRMEDVELEFVFQDKALQVWLKAEQSPVREIVLRFKGEGIGTGRILSDCWERAYGDLEWKAAQECIREKAVLPWYFFVDHGGGCRTYGVQVRPGAMCWWELLGEDVLLHLDVRNGSSGVCLKGRRMLAASVLMAEYCGNVFSATCDFCSRMCTDSLYDGAPVYGANNWYYAYGHSSRESLLEDAAFLSAMTEGLVCRPFMVIDDGWQSHHTEEYNGGPWREGNEKHGDMGALAGAMSALNVRPGLWLRPLYDSSEGIPDSWRSRRDPHVLDISVPEVLDHVRADLEQIMGWGFELVKHDFSTYDIFGRWGIHMGSELTDEGWQFRDNSWTTAELIVRFYEVVREASGNMLILGCNCIGHLGAGLMHLNRTGDDTSGVEWERTRKMGVNALAFRMPQHETFFGADADCVGITEHIDWDKNRQWMDLLSRSGTPFFVSVKPGTITLEQEQILKNAYQTAAAGSRKAIPLDWQEKRTPKLWKLGEEICCYEAFEGTDI